MENKNIRNSHFPISIFIITLGTVLLISGVHTGILVIFTVKNLGILGEIIIVISYWIIISLFFTLLIKWQMKKAYENPMQELAKAADAVAHGDFSVYVPTIHTSEKLDYLDVMIINFNKMVEELGSIETLKTDFFSNVSHEIKTPLTVISNYAQLLKKQGGLNFEQEEDIEIIISYTRKLSKLITNILKINRLEKQVISPELESYDLCNQLVECVLQFENQWQEKHIEFVINIEDKRKIKTDRNLLELVWNNLISNAIKFIEPGGTIILEEKFLEEKIIVSLKDTGCGMDKKTMEHIFEKFYQGDISHSMEGNGLGLALVKRVLEMLDSDITVESSIGKGTTFTVIISNAVKAERGEESE